MKRLALVLAVSGALLQFCWAQQAFLQSQLPLKVLVTTPSELASDETSDAAQPITLTGRQAITVSLGICRQVQNLKWIRLAPPGQGTGSGACAAQARQLLPGPHLHA